MKILVFNVGSSSIKFELFKSENDSLKSLNEGWVGRIGEKIKTHKKALNKLIEKYDIEIKEIDIIGHRVVHSGGKFGLVEEVDEKNLKKLKTVSHLAPLHNPPEVEVIEEIDKIREKVDVKQFMVFDCGFFKNLPKRAKIYGLPYSLYKDENIRRYGFHGISHKYLFNKSCRKEDLDKKEIKAITLHLGAGSSAAAILNSKPVDTSMGFTPLEGLIMQTRSGNIDPGIITYLQNNLDYDVKKINKLLNDKSGLLGITGGKFEDMRDILFLAGEKVEDKNYTPEGFDKCSKEDIERAKLAVEIFTYRVKKYIGAYTASLNGLDLLVFGGAIGSGSSVIREKIMKNMDYILKNTRITSIATDEERQIAQEVLETVK